ncbi:hypothetical protein T08_15677 [Trichinella sp. T8]|nr:hypothetical protein T08_15677 [Trichinella sp. T8]
MKTIKSHCFKMCKIESSNSHIKLTVLKTIAEAINSISNFTFNMLITNIEKNFLINTEVYHCSILECHQWNEVLEVVASASKSLGASKCMEQLEDKKHLPSKRSKCEVVGKAVSCIAIDLHPFCFKAELSFASDGRFRKEAIYRCIQHCQSMLVNEAKLMSHTSLNYCGAHVTVPDI